MRLPLALLVYPLLVACRGPSTDPVQVAAPDPPIVVRPPEDPSASAPDGGQPPAPVCSSMGCMPGTRLAAVAQSDDGDVYGGFGRGRNVASKRIRLAPAAPAK
jgi:hypothetical protein